MIYTRTSLPRPPARHRRLGQQIRVYYSSREAYRKLSADVDCGMAVLGFTRSSQLPLDL